VGDRDRLPHSLKRNHEARHSSLRTRSLADAISMLGARRPLWLCPSKEPDYSIQSRSKIALLLGELLLHDYENNCFPMMRIPASLLGELLLHDYVNNGFMIMQMPPLSLRA
jgi:hypothetical protein